MRLQRQRKAHEREGGDVPQAKGTKKRQSQGNPHLIRVKGTGAMYIKSYSWPTSPGRRREGQAYRVGKVEMG